MSLQIYNDIKGIINDILDAHGLLEIVTGTVISDSPLSVELSVTEEVFSERFLMIPEHLTDREIEMEYECYCPDNGGQKTQKIKVKNALKTGDQVVLVRCFSAQKFLILDRITS